MKGSIEVLKAGLMTSIQDLGRSGLAYYAIPHSGVMDIDAARIALLLLRRDTSEAVIECTSVAPTLRFDHPVQIAISGADFKWKINGAEVRVNTSFQVQANDILEGKFAKKGLRGYIAFDGKLDADEAFSSFSTYTKAGIGGFQGRLLRKGDILDWVGDKKDVFTLQRGPEYDLLHENGKRLLTSASFKIGKDTDRMGLRLEGYKVESSNYQLASSAPVLPGFMQLPPSGQPIIVLQDSQVTGGYPRIAYLKTKALSRLNQVPIGGIIRFDMRHG